MKRRDLLILGIATAAFTHTVVWFESYQMGVRKGLTKCPAQTKVEIIEPGKGRKICVSGQETSYATVTKKTVIKTVKVVDAPIVQR